MQQERVDKKIEIAKEMIKEGDTIAKTSRVTKLSIEIIEKLSKEV
ncbi:UNVERIFIED_CONTAM: hypothetical protein Cloal_3119 [Acetivibrio alkalicellulosi]